MKRGILAFLLAVLLILQTVAVSAAEPEAAQGGEAVGPLEETSQIDDPETDLRFSGTDGIIYRTEGLNKILCDSEGNAFSDLSFLQCEQIDGDVWMLKRQGAELPETCLVRADGTQITDWALCVYNFKNEFFAEAVFGDEQTKDEKEAMMYVTPDMFTTGFPGDDDVLFKGRKMLVDLKEGKLLEDVVLTRPEQNFTVVGYSYMVNDYDNPSRIMDASGKVLLDDASGIYNTDEYYYQLSEGKTLVYDDTMTRIAESENADGVIDGGFFSFSDENYNHGVMTFDGDVILEAKSNYMPRYMKGGLFIISGKNDAGDILYGLVDRDGKEILETKYYMLLDIEGVGYLYAKETSDSETMTLVSPDGRIISDQLVNYPNKSLTVEMEEKKYLVLNTGETLDLSGKESIESIGTALVSYRNPDTKKYGLSELYNGTELLGEEWDDIQTAYGKIYAYKDGKWHVFSGSSATEAV